MRAFYALNETWGPTHALEYWSSLGEAATGPMASTPASCELAMLHFR